MTFADEEPALWAGRATAEDVIDPRVGIEILHKCGDKVEAGTPLAVVHCEQEEAAVFKRIAQAFEIGDTGHLLGDPVLERIEAKI